MEHSRGVQRQFIEPRSSSPIHSEPRSTVPEGEFEDEFRALLRKHGVEYDPKCIFG
jgi:hypothetical protein